MDEVRSKWGSTSGCQPFLRIVDLHAMIVETTANQADVMQLRIGELVHLGFDAYPNLHLSGRVTAIGSIARTAGWRPSYVAEIPLTISIAGTDPKLIPGLSVSADVVLASSKPLSLSRQKLSSAAPKATNPVPLSKLRPDGNDGC